ncbi:uncharacterized protein PITG_04613 [Phytophthora infestans T30-4]|uniref:DNA ligase ATP-dependent N-terminal domain-containing protein n=1 Tax=Phytophthora infestans (strain T30-4) TaxID=403677 RepID=D0N1M7_PHYIT|nr:uncharacterized protein PITG_04613 [Phytophthora infestans T30-4]EEY68206.1 conserved hypothetical protein [Phytophthora infestans T30-4]|eukprot:XP_002905365.1 conserved hypothetical protein [Phytophthora infestans T30-4]
MAVPRRRWLHARLHNRAYRYRHSFLHRVSSFSTYSLFAESPSVAITSHSGHKPGSFKTLAHTFSAVEDVKNSRVAGVQLLSDGYRRLLALPTSQELACALYLTASQLAPPYEGVELRFGAKSFVRFLKQLETEEIGDLDSRETLEKLLATFPDYGRATQALLDSGRAVVPEIEDIGELLSIQAVYEQLMAIATDEGAGGVARKQQLALKLLQQCRRGFFSSVC